LTGFIALECDGKQLRFPLGPVVSGRMVRFLLDNSTGSITLHTNKGHFADIGEFKEVVREN
jgi:hypothetical protein